MFNSASIFSAYFLSDLGIKLCKFIILDYISVCLGLCKLYNDQNNKRKRKGNSNYDRNINKKVNYLHMQSPLVIHIVHLYFDYGKEQFLMSRYFTSHLTYG